jgi:peptidyl-prolyl cis-trans isomerase A (cyclophilin A)
MEIDFQRLAAGVWGTVLMTAIFAAAQTGTQSPPPAKRPASTQSTHAPATTTYDHALLNPKTLTATAPAAFDVKFVTSQGDFTVHVTRDWAPRGADRFYNLVRHHFYDGAYFFRVMPGFMAQFGISAHPEVAKAWENAKIPDDRVTHHNTRGMISFATAGANTRTTQVFINYADNSGLDAQGFAPFGQVTDGMEVVDKLYSGYGGDLDQDKLTSGGKAYIEKTYPKMDYIKTASLVPTAAPAK